ncbi:MAG: hypothetical protein HQL48_01790, partial [Gammaproteobacteria bacterium]|nr:hypothetical protein [Gammaproteobacteria bacterium]
MSRSTPWVLLFLVLVLLIGGVVFLKDQHNRQIEGLANSRIEAEMVFLTTLTEGYLQNMQFQETIKAVERWLEQSQDTV